MADARLDRFKLKIKPLSERPCSKEIERDRVLPGTPPKHLAPQSAALISELAGRIRRARENGRSVMLTYGAHTIKNGLAPVLINLIERGWLTHLATNGAGIIHDWEFAFQGRTSEDVRANVVKGEFGTWQETGYFINLAIIVGAYEGKGYGDSVGSLIKNEGLTIPDAAALEAEVRKSVATDPVQAAAAADLLWAIGKFKLAPGFMKVPHPLKRFSVQAAALGKGVPLTGHPMIGHDIIYVHPMNCCAAIGRAAERDFLRFAANVTLLDGGVYISLGSAIMSPMVFEKSLSMSQNLALQQGKSITDHYLMVVDLAELHWDWSKGEPPMDNPDYYMRYLKTFNRMGGTMRYVSADNRDFLLTLDRELSQPV